MSAAVEPMNWRQRALDAEQAVREMAGMLREIDPDPVPPADYVADERARAAVRRAMRNQRRRPKATKTLDEVIAEMAAKRAATS